MVALDSNVFVYALEAHPDFGPAARHWLKTTDQPIIASELVFAEVLAAPSIRTAHAEQSLLSALESLDISWRNASKQVMLTAAAVRRQYPSVKLVDAMHLATAQVAGADTFVTNDAQLVKLKLPNITIRGL